MRQILNVGILQSQLANQGVVSDELAALNISIPSLVVGTEAVGTYEYHSPDGILEANPPMTAEELLLTGSPEIGDTLTATFLGKKLYNDGVEGTHVYRWYRCNNTRSVGTLISGATTSSYVPALADDGKFLRVEGELVQIGGGNLTSRTYKSLFSSRISGAAFNPIVDLSWDTVFRHQDFPEFAATGVLPNSGSGSDATQDGVAALPVYNVTEDALEFTRASSQRLGITNQGQTQAILVYVKFKLKSLTGNQYLIGWTSSMFLSVGSTGNLNVCGGILSTGFAINTWYTLRIIINTTSTTVQVNNGSIQNIVSGVSAFGLGTSPGQIGASHSGTPGNHLNGYIKEIFVSNNEVLDSGHESDMWTALA